MVTFRRAKLAACNPSTTADDAAVAEVRSALVHARARTARAGTVARKVTDRVERNGFAHFALVAGGARPRPATQGE